MNNTYLLDAIKGAQIHKKVGAEIREIIKNENITLQKISDTIENKIKIYTEYDLLNPIKSGIAFPIGLSLNNCAAHFTPNSEDLDILLNPFDILKIDYGVHYNGIIIDSAFTISLDSKYDEFIDISRKLTQYAVSLCGPDVILGEMGNDIEEYIKSKEITIDNKIYSLKTMSDLSGHMIRPYEIHAGVAVPNISIYYPVRMKPNEFYAIEPFITTGNGKSILKEPNSHYMLNSKIMSFENLNKNEKKTLNFIKDNYYTLAFCERWISRDIKKPSKQTLDNLVSKKVLNSFPPIYDIDDSIVSQFEHTIYVKENGIINLTKNDYY
jgi:methionyl aminopeptidase